MIGIYASDFFNLGKNDVTKDTISNFVKELISDGDITATVNEEQFNAIKTKTNGEGRVPSAGEVNVTITKGETSVVVKVKVVFFRPPYVVSSNNRTPETHTTHNVGKLNVANPNDYTLTDDQKTKLTNDFKSANKNLNLDNATYSMDNKGNLTVTQDGHSFVVPSDYFISDIGFVKDILVLHKIGNNNTEAISEIKIPIKSGKTYQSIWGANGTGIGKGDTKGLSYTLGANENVVKITGTYTGHGTQPNRSRGRYEIWGKYGFGLNEDKFDKIPGNSKNSFSNVFKVRVLRIKDSTVIRCVDEDANERFDEQKDIKDKLGVDWDALKKYNAPDDADSVTDDQVRKAVKERVEQVLDTNNQQLQHNVGVQIFKGKVKLKDQGNQESPEVTATRIYYTKNIPVTVVSNQTGVSEEEKKAIIKKVKDANGYDETNNPFEVTVGNDGRVTLKYNVKNTDKNGVEHDNFTVDLGRPVQQFQFKDSEVKPGKTVTVDKPAQVDENSTTELKKDNDGNLVKVPEGTTFGPPDNSGVTPDTDGSFTIPVAHDNSSVNVKVTPQKDGTLKFEVPENAPTDIEIDVPIKVTIPNQDGKVINAKVKILKLDKEVYNPVGGIIEKKYEDSANEEEVFGKIKIENPAPTNDKMPKYSLEKGSTIPTGEQSGKTDVKIKATYTDGSTDDVTVTVIIGPKPPTVTAKDDGSVEVTPDDTNATEMTVKYTPEGEGATETTVTVTKGTDGKWSLPQGTQGLTIDANSGKVTIPEANVKDKSEVKATVKMSVKVGTESKSYESDEAKDEAKSAQPGYANIKYVLQKGFNSSPQVIKEIEDKFKPDDATDQSHPTKIEGKNGRAIALDDFDLGEKNQNAPKFIGYTFQTKGSSGQLGNYNTDLTKAGTIYLTYNKLDEIQEGGEGKTCPDGYVVVTFKDAEGAKLDNADTNKVFYVNKKAGVKIELKDGKYCLVGKDANEGELKKEIPTVTADQGYEVDYHKPSDTETTTWGYDNYNLFGQEITEAKDFTAKVKSKINEPKKTFVKDPQSLTDDEKKAVKKAVEDANKDKTGKSTLPDGAEINVDDKGNVTVKKGDTEIGKLTPDKTIFTVKSPVKTYVKDAKKLTDDEKKAVKKAIEDANKDDKGKSTLPDDTQIEVKDDGTTEIKDKEGNVITTLTPDQTITTVKEPSKTLVKDPKKLTPEEKEKVKKAVEEINKDETGNSTLPDGSVIQVEDDGTVIIKDKKGDDGKEIDRLTPEQTIVTLKAPEKTLVKNPTNLTPLEKAAVEEKIKKANPELPRDFTVVVNDDGSVIINDNNKKEFGRFTPAETIFTNELPAPTIDPIYETDEIVSGKAEPFATVTIIFPPQYEGDKPVIVTTVADRDGNYIVDVPYEVQLHEFDKVYAYQELDGVRSKDTVTEVRYDDYYDRRQYDHRYDYEEETKEEPKAKEKKPAKPIRVWTPEQLNASVHKAYIKGYPDGTFAPSKTITRAEVAMIFGRLSVVKDANNALGFKDIKANDWFKKAVDIVSKQGIVKGYEDGSFMPNKPITRREFAAIVGRYAKNIDAWKTFVDVKPTDWAYQSINKAAGIGWINGYEDGTFKPDNLITRAEVVAIVNRMLNRSADSVFVDTMLYKNAIKSFNDVLRNAWYFYDIYEASVGHDFTRKEDGKSENWTRLNGQEFSLNY